MSSRDDKLLVEDILEAANKILKYTEGMNFDTFLNDEKTIDAVVRNFEIIGEASSRLSENYKASKNDIPWNRLKGFRNRLVHEYFGVDYMILWTIIQDELEILLYTIQNENPGE
jgi:uncharacterized protein with HEPN domain